MSLSPLISNKFILLLIDLDFIFFLTNQVLKSHQDMQTVSEEIVSEPDKNQPIVVAPASGVLYISLCVNLMYHF